MSLDSAYDKVISIARNAFNSGKTRSLPFRRAQLKNFLKMVEDNRESMEKAANLDLRKHKLEVTLYEIEGLLHEAHVLLDNLADYAKPDSLPFNLLAAIDKAETEKVPYGLVLILGAWNYPFMLSLQPMMGAIAAGNCVILKPSEVAPHTAELMAQMVPKYLDPECYHVIQAGPEETQQLLQHKFDYIFYTGSTNVGRVVMQAAANHLTPVTLELGGKSPVYIDDDADYEIACRRIMWGRFANSGQTCIAPDYVLCSKKVQEEIATVGKKIVKEFYGEDPQRSESYPRVINEKHTLRLQNLLGSTKGRIAVGGRVDVSDKFVEPTIVADVKLDDILMQDEIFGPILPIVVVGSVEEAIEIVNSRPRPLALYSFSKNDKVNQLVKERTISGGVCLNDTMWHCVWNGLPFGGVGDSGMGSYHGKFSFDTFTHRRAVLNRSLGRLTEKLGAARYPPYADSKIKQMKFIIHNFLKFNVKARPLITHTLAFLLGGAIVAAIILLL